MADDSFLENCQGWTPSPDALVRKKRYGFEGAYLWGRLRRLCQLGKGTYTISHEALGNRIGMSRRTVIKYLDRLIEDGYVDDLTPDVRNKSHTYSVKRGEDKILLEVQAGMQISHTETATPDEAKGVSAQDNGVGMRNLHTSDEKGSAEIAQQDGLGVQDLHSGYAKNAQDGMQNLHLNRESLDTIKDTKEFAPKKVASPEQNKLFLILAGLCHVDLKVATDKQIGQLDQAAKALIKTVEDSDQFKDKFGVYWLTVDWRGKQGQPPTPAQIREVYGDYSHWLEHGQQARKDTASNGYKRQQKQQQPITPSTPSQEDHLRKLVIAQAAANDAA